MFRAMGRIAAGLAALAGVAMLAECKPAPVDTGVQGWNADQQAAWSNADQGSRLMPIGWLMALEQPDAPGAPAPGTARPFLDNTYLAGFRILPALPGTILPIGFAKDSIDDSRLTHTSLHWLGKPAAQDRVDWVGLTCAACHTGELNYEGKTLRVFGAPSLFDYQGFVEAVDRALGQTRASADAGADSGRWDRFAKAVLGTEDTAANRQNLTAALDKLIGWEATAETLNHTDLRYGFGRVDAIGHIYNRVLMFGGAAQVPPNAADAPVSFPHLWNITKETHLQWDGIATADKIHVGGTPTDFGALGRNVGEVLGVFGEAVPHVPSGPTDLSGFATSAQVDNLNAIEVELTKLLPPAWPAAFGAPGAIDVTDDSGHKLSPAEVLSAGGTIFASECADCHTSHIPQGGAYETMKTFAQLTPANQTDEWMACNAWIDTGSTGSLAGVPIDYIKGDATAAAGVPVRQLLATTVEGALVNQKQQLIEATIQNVFDITPLPRAPHLLLQPAVPVSAKQQRLNTCMKNASDPLMAYKARPLEGIWATGPYLHNGSVPTLYDLLLPPGQRPATFAVGTRNYDVAKAGYDTAPTAPGNSFVFDTSLPGNSNKGHVYGVGDFSKNQRLELLEYLKSL